MSNRLTVLKSVLWMFVGICAVVTAARFTHGLGATTNLSDVTPWGLWIGFDVMAGVALAAGGFVLAATVYIFRLERFRPFVRPAILTAFLGYAAVAIGLLYDLGLPWNIWHPMVHWQHHSVLFEVAMCVMLYLTVLALEFAPAVLEHSAFNRPLFHRILTVLKRVTLLLVIAGIILSTLHQSSLGSLFLIAPHRLHPLWYSPIIYVLFFVSAVALGLMMVTLESLLSGYFFHHRVRTGLLSGLGLAASAVLVIYVVLRVGDLAIRGALTSFDGSGLSLMFLFELGISAILPAALLMVPEVRRSIAGLAVCSGLVVSGMVLYRINVCIVAFARPPEVSYFPHWTELAVSVGIVSAAVLIFIFFVEHLRVYDEPAIETMPAPAKPSFDPATLHSLMPGGWAAPRRYSLIFIITASATVALLPERAVLGNRPRETPVQAPRSVEGILLERTENIGTVLRFAHHSTLAAADIRRKPLLMIDGNRDGRLVLFDHRGHEARLGGDISCGECHHMNLPYEQASSCYACHRDMYEPTATFNHETHVTATNGNAGCLECHATSNVAKTMNTATACAECHSEGTASCSTIAAPPDRWNNAVGYMDAMHDLCIKCHEHKLPVDTAFPAALTECRGCHDADNAGRLQEMLPKIERAIDERDAVAEGTR